MGWLKKGIPGWSSFLLVVKWNSRLGGFKKEFQVSRFDCYRLNFPGLLVGWLTEGISGWMDEIGNEGFVGLLVCRNSRL